MTNIIQIVVIADENNGIGKDNQLLYHMPADLKHFKQLTLGAPVIMGRKTFESIGKPLINRRNIIITKQNLSIDGCEIAHSLEEAMKNCSAEEKISVIGGETIFRQSLHLAHTVHLTRLHHTFEADSFFPQLNPGEWKEADAEYHQPDEKNAYPYTFITYTRI